MGIYTSVGINLYAITPDDGKYGKYGSQTFVATPTPLTSVRYFSLDPSEDDVRVLAFSVFPKFSLK